MLRFFRKRKEPKPVREGALFYEKAVIDVTNFDARSPADSLGYLCGCRVAVLRDGLVEFVTDDKNQSLLERFSVSEIVRADDSVGAPQSAEILIATKSKAFRISFRTQVDKNGFWNRLTAAYDKQKQG